MLVAAGCGGTKDERPTPVEPPPRPTPARLAVRVAAGGYDIDVTAAAAVLDSGAPRPVPVAGAAVFDGLAPGPRLVRLTGVGATCAVAGPNPRSVTLAAGQDTTVTFDVACRTRVARVALARAYESVLVGDTLMPVATAYTADGAVLPGRAVAWGTSSPGALAVTAAGVATGLTPGAVRLTAEVDGVRGEAEVTVFAPVARAPRGFSYVADSVAGGGAPTLFRLRHVPADGGAARTLVGPAEFLGDHRWAPGGDRLLVTYAPSDGRPAGTYLVDLAAGRERLLGAGWASPAWAPDGARVAYGAYDAGAGGHAVVVLDLRDGSTRQVLAPAGVVDGVDWSPDARRLAVRRRPGGPGSGSPHALWVVPLGAGAARALALPTRAANAAWSPDGRRLAYDDGDGLSSGPPTGVWVVDADGADARRLDIPCPAAIGAGCATGYPAWSPDGRRIAVQQLPGYTTSAGRHVTFRDVDGGATGAVPAGGPCCGATPPRWSADGTSVLVTAARPAPEYWPSVARVRPGAAAAEFLTTGSNAAGAEWVP